MLCAFAEWLCSLAPLAAFSPAGIRTGTMPPGPGCSLCPSGGSRTSEDIVGNRTGAQQFTLSICGVCLCEAQYDALYKTAQDTAFAVQEASDADMLPALDAPLYAQGVDVKAPGLDHVDDSGLAVFTLELTLIFQKPAQPVSEPKG